MRKHVRVSPMPLNLLTSMAAGAAPARAALADDPKALTRFILTPS